MTVGVTTCPHDPKAFAERKREPPTLAALVDRRHEGCSVRGCPNRKRGTPTMVCSQCRLRRYCGATCQKRDWASHGPACTLIRNESYRKGIEIRLKMAATLALPWIPYLPSGPPYEGGVWVLRAPGLSPQGGCEDEERVSSAQRRGPGAIATPASPRDESAMEGEAAGKGDESTDVKVYHPRYVIFGREARGQQPPDLLSAIDEGLVEMLVCCGSSGFVLVTLGDSQGIYGTTPRTEGAFDERSDEMALSDTGRPIALGCGESREGFPIFDSAMTG